jgi:hypothetical protein
MTTSTFIPEDDLAEMIETDDEDIIRCHTCDATDWCDCYFDDPRDVYADFGAEYDHVYDPYYG